MGDDDAIDDDGYDFRPPPPLDDRLWRHPAELARVGVAPAPRAQLRRSPWALGFVSVVGSAFLAGSLMFAAGGIGDEPRDLGLAPVATLVAAPGDGVDVPGVVAIEVDTERRGRAGNGMVLADGRHVLTSLQLVRTTDAEGPRTDVRVIDEHGASHHGTVVATDELSDLAIIRTDTSGLRPLDTTAGANPLPDAALTLLGGGRGAGLRGWDVRVVTAATTTDTGLVGVLTVDRALPSVALGAIAVDADGRLAGIASFDVTDATVRDHPAVLVPAARLRQAAQQFLATGAIVHGWLGVEAAAGEGTRNVALHEGTTVAEVVPDSPAAVAGVQAGDVLVRVCDQPVSSIDDVLRVMLLTEPGTVCSLDAVRDGRAWHTSAIVGRRTAA